jgi:hypothetical protein
MLSRIEVGSKEHTLLWLGDKDQAETYEWNSGQCPAAQYSREFGDEHIELNLIRINTLARVEPHTWGALYERAKKTWI